MSTELESVELDGESLTPPVLFRIGKGQLLIKLSKAACDKIVTGRTVVDEILQADSVVYGITTGFGNFANVVISKEDTSLLQQNLIRSHAAGVGNPLPIERARMLMALRINVLAKGYSGIRLKTVQQFVDALNSWCVPYIPEQGTVGASGDLAPLAHMALGLMGEGKMWDHENQKWAAADAVLTKAGLHKLDLEAKEGLALINGTQFITALGAEAVVRSTYTALQADVVAALTLECLMGSFKAFDARIHAARPHSGQMAVAARMRKLLLNASATPSEIYESHHNCNRVQDSYTLRCIPQVHGVVHDTVEFVRGIIQTELNSATDNPMIFADTTLNSDLQGFNGKVVSGGNFHGEYPAKALDYLAIGIHELANISERRIERLVNASLSGLPPFLVGHGGLNSGFMIAHCTAAGLTSENKVLVHPSSSDTISTSAAKEDHVSMGGFSARKALLVVENVERVVAIELLAACQALEFLRPLKTTPALESVYQLVRSKVQPYDKDRYIAPDIEAVHMLLKEGKVWDCVKNLFTEK